MFLVQLRTAAVGRNINLLPTSTAKALAVSINSQGGFPAQCEIIVNKLRTFCHQHHIPLLTFAEDVAVSGGYMILCAGDKVYADRSSIVGSIGVVIARAQLAGLKTLLGVENWNYTSDEYCFLHLESSWVIIWIRLKPQPKAQRNI